jgi:hypothetical protein
MFENISLESVLIGLGILLILWVGARFILRFTMRIFSCGVAVLILIGAGWLLLKLVF